MPIEDQVVELKFKHREVENKLTAQDKINEQTASRFENVEKLINEQNEFLASINVTLSKLQASFTSVMTLVDKWVQRIVGGAVALLIVWVVLADAPLEKIKWVMGLFS